MCSLHVSYLPMINLLQKFSLLIFLAILVSVFNLPIPTVNAAGNAVFYNDALSNGWVNWSWGSLVDFGSANAFSGSRAIAFTPNSGWAGLYLHNDTAIDANLYKYLNFAAKATATSQKFSVGLYDAKNKPLGSFLPLSNYGDFIGGVWKSFSIPLVDLKASGKFIKGIVLQEATGQSQSTLYIDDVVFAGGIEVSPSPTTATPTPPPPSAPIATGAFTAANGKIYKNGSEIKLRGVNWFGFETGTFAAHGLWARNYKDMILQMKNLGFNAVRVPVCPSTLAGVGVNSIDYSRNKDLANLNSLQVLDKVLAELNAQGMYVLLDHHRPDCQAISELWQTGSYSENDWIRDLTFMATRYSGLANFVGIDLKNEPHGSATWGIGNTATDWNLAAERAGKAVLSANPNILVFVEGVGENSHCSSNFGHFWGQNLEVQKCVPISTNAIPANKLVLSPHIYGPDVAYQSYFSDASFPSNMPSIWDTQFGYLADKGFTLAPGEWGGKYGTNGGDSKDGALQNALVSYYKSKHICNSFYWGWNPNSGDTGGILQDDWITPWSSKVSLITNYFNSCN